MSTQPPNGALTLLIYERQLQNLVSGIAYGQDWLDYTFMGSLWLQSGIHFDLSGHLPEHSAPHLSIPTLLSKVKTALSGFEATRHLLSNVAVNFKHQEIGTGPEHAEVLAQTYAYHELEGEHVIALTTWRVSAVRRPRGQGVPAAQQAKLGDMGDWVADGIMVERGIPLQGVPELYERAKARAERGEGRQGSGELRVPATA